MNYGDKHAAQLSAQAAKQAEYAQIAASQVGENSPGQIIMLTKRAEELASYGGSVSERTHGSLNRILGAIPEGATGDNAAICSPSGEWGNLEMAFRRIERVIAELDGAARRLEGL